MNETIYCKHCLTDVDDVDRHGLCGVCADEYVREFMADLAFEDARCN